MPDMGIFSAINGILLHSSFYYPDMTETVLQVIRPTDKAEQTLQTQIRLIRVNIICQFSFAFGTHYCIVEQKKIHFMTMIQVSDFFQILKYPINSNKCSMKILQDGEQCVEAVGY